jgi:excisionase family DNA binding protein
MSHRQGYFRAREIAELTGLSLRTVRRRIADETLRSVKWGGARLVPHQSSLVTRAGPLGHQGG